MMKKSTIVVLMTAVALLWACGSSEKKGLAYRGLSMAMPFHAFCDSLAARGFAIDSAKSNLEAGTVVMASPAERYRISMALRGDTVVALQENYLLTTNDSTRQQWQAIRDQLEKELGAWPNMPKHGDDHKIAKFEADGGFITVTLENTYKPTLSVLYQAK